MELTSTLVFVLVLIFSVIILYINSILSTLISICLCCLFGALIAFIVQHKNIKKIFLNRNLLEKNFTEKNYLTKTYLTKLIKNDISSCEALKYQEKTKKFNENDHNYFQSSLLISKNVDLLLEEIINFILRDYLFDWYDEIIGNNNNDDVDDKNNDQNDMKKTFKNIEKNILTVKLKNELWIMTLKISDRLKKVDYVNLLTKDFILIIQTHFNLIKLAKCNNQINLDHYIENEKKERKFLRKLSKVILYFLLPNEYFQSKPIMNLLNEIFANCILYNVINLITDPDYINEKIYLCIKQQRIENEKISRRYACAATYEAFIDMITKCTNIDDLKRIRYHIITEIMQASAMNSIKRDKAAFDEQTTGAGNTTAAATGKSAGSAKGVFLMNRDLKKYINQLNFAKKLCNRRINRLLLTTVPSTANLISSTTFDNEHPEFTNYKQFAQPKDKKVFGFKVIMFSNVCRNYFKKFLQNSIGMGSSATDRTAKHLILFWESINDLSHSNGIKQYQIANEILTHSYYINSVQSHTKLTKNYLKGMQQFIKGDKGPESFYEIQSIAYEILENRYYPLFIVSKEYDEMMNEYDDIEYDTSNVISSHEEANEAIENSTNCLSHDNSIIDEHIKCASSKLKILQQRLYDKNQALTAVKVTKTSQKTNTKLASYLSKEIVDIEDEIHQLTKFIRWSQQWKHFILQWKANIQDIQMDCETSDSTPLVIIIIHLDERFGDKLSSGGWVITRTINEFIELKRKLIRLKPELRKIEILRLKHVSQNQAHLIKKCEENLQQMVKIIFADEDCLKFEDTFLFFCPSSETVKQSLQSNRNQTNKSQFLPFAKLFGISRGSVSNDRVSLSSETNLLDDDAADNELNSLFTFDGDDGEVKDSSNDNIAEPFYCLISEIFELSGAIGFLRKTLMMFVQVSYGQTINKQFRETIEWITSESMVNYYLQSFKDSFWPDGNLANNWQEKSEQEKNANELLAKQMLIENIPEIMNKLLGNQNAKKGTLKIFNYLQNKPLNKQLLYDLLQSFLTCFLPELNSNQIK